MSGWGRRLLRELLFVVVLLGAAAGVLALLQLAVYGHVRAW